MNTVSKNILKLNKTANLSLLLVSCTILTCLDASAAEPAAESNAVLEEIIVTAQKRAENVQSVPLSIVSVSGEAMRDNGVDDALDLGKIVPSLKVFNSSTTPSIQFRIRGFGSSSDTSIDSDVASYVDGAFIPRPGALLGAFLDIKNVEVLSGPQGTLFGRNAAMGAVSINTNSPSATQSFDASVEGGSYGTYKGTAIVNVPVSEAFVLRGAFQSSHTDGLFHNKYDGKRYGETTDYVGRISSKWDISPAVSWVMRVEGSKTTGDGHNANVVYTDTASAAQLTALQNFMISQGGSPLILSSKPSLTLNAFIGSPSVDEQQFGITSDLSWDISSNFTVRMINTYRDWDNRLVNSDPTGITLSMLRAEQVFNSEATSHELQFISSKDAFFGGRAGITSGLYYFHENYGIDVTFGNGSDYCRVLFSSLGLPFLIGPCQAGPQMPAAFMPFEQSTTSLAGYAQINYSILPSLELNLGGRLTSEKKTGTYTQNLYNAIAQGQVVAPEGPEALSFKDSTPSGRASLQWYPMDDIMLFGTLSTGYKSGGFNSGAASPPLDSAKRTYEAETVRNYEFGIKSTLLDQRLIFNATFFYTKLFNFQERSFNGVSFLIRNAGDVRSRGVDFNGRIAALPNLILDYGATYLDSVYAKNVAAPGLEGCGATPTGAPINPACPLTQNLSGQPVPHAPKWQGHVGANWTVGKFNGYELDMNVGENFSSSFLSATSNNPQSRLKSYATTDVKVGVTSPSGRWKVDVFGTNVFDKRYYVTGVAQLLGNIMPGVNNTATGATVFRGFLGDPARFGVRASASF